MSTIQQISRIQAHRHHNAPSYRYPGLAVRCMKCNREKVGKTWLFTKAPAKITLISHGVCPECKEYYLRELRSVSAC